MIKVGFSFLKADVYSPSWLPNMARDVTVIPLAQRAFSDRLVKKKKKDRHFQANKPKKSSRAFSSFLRKNSEDE